MEDKTEIPNLDQIKAISSMMGGEDFNQGDLIRMMETANRVKGMMQLFQDTTKEDEPKMSNPALGQKAESISGVIAEKEAEEEAFSFANQQEKMIYAAIPFLDRDYQKNLYVIVRLMELRRVMGQGELLESRSRTKDDIPTRRKKLLQALKPYLEVSDRRSIDHMVKMMDMKRIMERKEEENGKSIL